MTSDDCARATAPYTRRMDDLIEAIVGALVDLAGEAVPVIAEAAGDALGAVAELAADGAGEVLGAAAELAGDAAGAAMGGIVDAAGSLGGAGVEALVDALGAIPEAVRGVLGSDAAGAAVELGADGTVASAVAARSTGAGGVAVALPLLELEALRQLGRAVASRLALPADPSAGETLAALLIQRASAAPADADAVPAADGPTGTVALPADDRVRSALATLGAGTDVVAATGAARAALRAELVGLGALAALDAPVDERCLRALRLRATAGPAGSPP